MIFVSYTWVYDIFNYLPKTVKGMEGGGGGVKHFFHNLIIF